jgi:surface polysaccharide O-acyltransferase-like enzyme
VCVYIYIGATPLLRTLLQLTYELSLSLSLYIYIYIYIYILYVYIGRGVRHYKHRRIAAFRSVLFIFEEEDAQTFAGVFILQP